MSSFCEVRVAPTPSVGDGAGVDEGMNVGVGEGDATEAGIGTLVGAGTADVTVARGAAVEVGAAVDGGRKSAQAIAERIKTEKAICMRDFANIKLHYIP